MEGLVSHAQKVSMFIQARCSVSKHNKIAKLVPVGWKFGPTGQIARV